MDFSILFSIFSLTLIIICSTENLINAAALPQCSSIERAALVRFKANILKDKTGILSSWNIPNCCEWEGVTCNLNTGRVTALQIQRSSQDMSLYMKGTISSSLANLRYLETLVISGMKKLTGTIPESFATLNRLTVLYLEDNALHGTIPLSFGYMTSLKYLSLSGNKLQGCIPPSLGYVNNHLVQLTLSRNLLSGPLPSTFKNPLLEILDLSFNFFSNMLNSSIFSQSKSITYIDLSHNKFSGEIPVSICYLPSVSYVDLSQNNFTGNIPSNIGRLKSLKALSLASNLLTGSVPRSIGNLDKLWLLNVSRNGLSGPLPNLITNELPSLSSIDLSYNKFHLGIFPNWLKLKHLTTVSLAGCGIEENFPVFTYPDIVANTDLSDNLFTGDISAFIAKMSSLQSFRLSNNKYVSNVSKLVLPDTLSTFDISSNKVYGKLPEFDEMSNLKSIIMSNNYITGEIPRTISNLRFLEKLDISRNQISGSIPETMGSMTSLQWLDFSNNKFTGRIPESFKNLVEIHHANFRGNMLCGEIPQARPFNVFRSIAYAHNLCLCGKPLPPCKTKSK